MICSIEDCNGKHYGRGYCAKHYQRFWKTGDPLSSGNPTRGIPLSERFWRFVDWSNLDGCWEWTGPRLKGTYGQFKIRGKNIGAHRIAYQLETGPEPKLDVLHSCDNPPCVNPAHLREGTHAENMRDKVLRNRHRPSAK